MDWKGNSTQKAKLVEWSETAGLNQIITDITRYRCVKTEKGTRAESSIIDHVYVEDYLSWTLEPTPWSDREVLILELQHNHDLGKVKKKKILQREWRNYKAETFINKLKSDNRSKTNLHELMANIKVNNGG